MAGERLTGVQVGILGPLQVTSSQGDAVVLGGARLRALLIRLALDAGSPVRGEALAEALWADGGAAPGDRANALQSLVSRLRRALPEPGLIVSEPGGYRLAVAPDAVDAARFERLAAEGRRALGRGEPGAAAGPLRAALALWRGPALADAGDAPYAAAPVARLDELRRAAVEDLAEAELAAGRPAAALAVVLADLESLVAEHPLRERPRGLLMRARYAAGRQAEALAGYEEYRALLADELGTDPAPELRELHLSVLRADPALAPLAPGHAPGHAPAGNLRAALTSFVGRDEELRLIGKRLTEARLVTLVGPGGAGKTRLATTAAAEHADGFAGGTWLVELASVTDPEDVARAVLDTLGGGPAALLEPRRATTTPRGTLDLLVDSLSRGPTLLLLDNCEHLVDAAARLADQLLGRCPRLRVLATSREPLGIFGEVLSPVEPLRLPAPAAGAEEAAASPAVRLLADRAAAVRPGFAVHEGNVGAVREICHRLDGLPLAIELAAARLRTLDPDHLASRLDDRFRLLSAGSRTALPRHQTLRAVVDWSWELLTDDERRLAERLAVFAGGVTPASAEGVCGVAAGEALEALTSLADRSLLQLADGGDPSGPRFRMLETLREYGAERLAAAGLTRRVRDAHAAHFLRLAETAEPHLRGHDQLAWLATLNAERDNLLAALHHAAAVGDADTAVRLVAALGLYWTMRGSHAEAAHWLRFALDVPGESPWAARTVARALYVLSTASAGRPAEAWAEAEGLRTELVEPGGESPHPAVLALLHPALAMFMDRTGEGLRSSDLALDHPDPWTRAMLRLMRATIRENDGDPDGVWEELKPALAGFREAGDRWGLGMALTTLGVLHRQRGELAAARESLSEALRLAGELRAETDLDQLRALLALVRAEQGEHLGVREELADLAEAADQRGAGYQVAHVRLALGDLAREAGEMAEARAQYESALRHVERRTFVQPQLSSLLRAGLAMVVLSEGDAGAAGALLGPALEEVNDVWDMPVLSKVGVALAELCERRGEPALAAEALGAAERLRGMPDLSGRDAGVLAARLRDTLAADYAAAFERGARLDRAAAVDLLRAAAVGPDGQGEEHREQAGRPQQRADDRPGDGA
ncbi:BTAD domain-containing putative transcriptional regulator [Streptomyces hainanensis]|uniref:Helix-turn-helix domain-containing protein n=1 Tax=Streptomyces hainanensis TaxID=402648 RepID=A0A4R4TQG1_9ACTN|nr:BTAD domain-containing putative transcriptional regulator [Streptomyces hainanensis]TDC80437.1 helix-turn-helix domain-containing protein [Streptomyces hainanensis]